MPMLATKNIDKIEHVHLSLKPMYLSYHFSNLTHGVVIGVKQSCFHLFLEINLSILQYLVQYLIA